MKKEAPHKFLELMKSLLNLAALGCKVVKITNYYLIINKRGSPLINYWQASPS